MVFPSCLTPLQQSKGATEGTRLVLAQMPRSSWCRLSARAQVPHGAGPSNPMRSRDRIVQRPRCQIPQSITGVKGGVDPFSLLCTDETTGQAKSIRPRERTGLCQCVRCVRQCFDYRFNRCRRAKAKRPSRTGPRRLCPVLIRTPKGRTGSR